MKRLLSDGPSPRVFLRLSREVEPSRSTGQSHPLLSRTTARHAFGKTEPNNIRGPLAGYWTSGWLFLSTFERESKKYFSGGGTDCLAATGMKQIETAPALQDFRMDSPTAVDAPDDGRRSVPPRSFLGHPHRGQSIASIASISEAKPLAAI